MEEQEAGGQQILDSIARLKEITVSVRNGSSKMTQSGTDLIRGTDEFIKISHEAMNSMTEVVEGALKEIKAAVFQVNEMNSENNRNFEDLKNETVKFKVDTGHEKKKVLMIDDDAAHLEITRNFMIEEYEVITTKSCADALKLLYQGLDPDYILLDLLMPDTDGWETYERIRGLSNLHHVPVAIFTSSDDQRSRDRAIKMGAADFINKPCKKNELLEKIKKTLSKSNKK
jgi:PleD family two-component response regulator